MATVYWQPLGTTDLLRRQIDRVFNEAADTLAKERGSKMSSTSKSDERSPKWYPAVELMETPEAFHLRAVLPAVDAASIDVQATRYGVMLSGVRALPELGEEQQMLFSELAYGDFQRIIELPAEIHPEQVEANFQDGMLVVTLPKADLQHKVQIRVNSLTGADQTEAIAVNQEEAACV